MGNTIALRNTPISNIKGFNSKWAVNRVQLEALSYSLNEKTFFSDASYLFNNPSDALVSVKAYPFNVMTYLYGSTGFLPQKTDIKLGKITVTDSSSVTQQGYPLADIAAKYKSIGTIQIDRKFNNFLDYSKYTKLELYIPFCGFINLDTDIVMGHEIRLFLSVDFDSGNCTGIVVRHTADQAERDGDVIMTANGICGFDIPLGSSNANENKKTMAANGLSIATGAITSIIMKNPLPLGMMASTAIGGSFSAMQERISKGGAVNGFNSMVLPYNAYLIRTTAIPVEDPIKYAKYEGLMLRETREFSKLKGFTQVESIHLDNVDGATTFELNEIESLLKSGIIL